MAKKATIRYLASYLVVSFLFLISFSACNDKTKIDSNENKETGSVKTYEQMTEEEKADFEKQYPFNPDKDKKLKSIHAITKRVTVVNNFEDPLFWPQTKASGRSNASRQIEVKERFGLECLRKGDGFAYSVHKIKTKDGKKVYLFFSYVQDVVTDCWVVRKLIDKDTFKSKIIPGQTRLKDVQKLDPSPMIDARIREGKSAYHRFEDGHILIVEYENAGSNPKVKSVRETLDPANIVRNLYVTDLKLIQ